MRPFARFLLLALVTGLCLSSVAVATPIPAGAASRAVALSSPAAVTTVPTVTGILADGTPIAVARAVTQTAYPTVTMTVRATTPRSTATPGSTPALTTRPTASGTQMPDRIGETTATAPSPGVTSANALSSYTPIATTSAYSPPIEARTPDIDPGMTPYSGPTEMGTVEETPTGEGPAVTATATAIPTATPLSTSLMTAEAPRSPGYELPPGAYGVERTPTPTGTATVSLLPVAGEGDAAGSLVLMRWLGYLIVVLLGIAGVTGIALARSRLRSSGSVSSSAASLPARSPSGEGWGRLLRAGAPALTMEGQALIHRIARLDLQSMRVERIGRTLLRLEREAQRAAGDSSIRFDGIIDVAAIPSAPVPAAATDWARAHGFRIIAADASGLALLTPTLAGMHRSTLGVLPLGEMVDGASPMPMAIVLGSSGTISPHRASVPGRGAL